MKRFLPISSLLLFALTSTPSLAADKTIGLSVPDMNCPSCPYMVKQSLSKVAGVRAAEVDHRTRTAQVTFDDAIASVDDILGATAAIGYESTLVAAGEGS